MRMTHLLVCLVFQYVSLISMSPLIVCLIFRYVSVISMSHLVVCLISQLLICFIAFCISFIELIADHGTLQSMSSVSRMVC